MQFLVLNRFSTASLQFTRVIPEIDIWRAANLMLKRYGEKAFTRAARAPTSLPPTAITMARRRGAELPPQSSSSLTTYRLARLTDRNGPETVGPPLPGVLLENRFHQGPESTNFPGPNLPADFDFA